MNNLKNCSDRGVLMARKNLLKGFKKPKGITFEHLETNPNYGKFTAYPFDSMLPQWFLQLP